MRLKTTTTNACQETLLRRGFEAVMNSSSWLRLGGDKPGAVYEAWFHGGEHRRGYFVQIQKGTVEPSSEDHGWPNWDFSSTIKLIFV